MLLLFLYTPQPMAGILGEKTQQAAMSMTHGEMATALNGNNHSQKEKNKDDWISHKTSFS